MRCLKKVIHNRKNSAKSYIRFLGKNYGHEQ